MTTDCLLQNNSTYCWKRIDTARRWPKYSFRPSNDVPSRRWGGSTAASMAMERRKNNGTAPLLQMAVHWSNSFVKSPPSRDHLRPIEVRSADIWMGDPNVPQPRDFGRIQYWLTEIDLGDGKADGHFWWKMAMRRWWWKSARCEVAFFVTRKTQQLHFSVKIVKCERSGSPSKNSQG